jgi:hypothetical protein
MYSLIWWSVTWRPGKSDPSKIETNQKLDPVDHNRQTGSEKRAAGDELPSLGLRPHSVSSPPAHSHPD